jgi:hypothetical protein
MSHMRSCTSCGGELVRVRRALREKFVYLAVMKCRKCGRRETMDQWFLFLFGRTSRCPRCGGYRVDKLRGVDHIDPMYKNPISYMQKWFGANVHWCGACRLQFYDLRERVPYSKRMPRPVSTPADVPADIADPSDAGS